MSQHEAQGEYIKSFHHTIRILCCTCKSVFVCFLFLSVLILVYGVTVTGSEQRLVHNILYYFC